MKQSNLAPRRCQSAAAALCVALTLTVCGAPPGTSEAAAEVSQVNLDALTAEALRSNPELAFYRAEIAAARGGRRQAGIYANPDLTTEVGGNRVRGGGMSAEGTAWSVSVMQTFEYPGRMALRKAIANQDVTLAELGFDHFTAALEARAGILGYRLLLAQQRAQAISEVANRLQELLGVLVQREPGGITPLIEVRIIEASVVTFRRRAIEAAQALQSALFDVNLIRGQSLGTPLQIADSDPVFPDPPPMAAMLESARNKNFEIRMRLAELEQQGFELRLGKKQRWPDVSVGPFVSRETAGDRETVAGIGISLPLPFWNRNAGNVEIEEARLEQAETSMFLTQTKVEQAVMETYLAYELAVTEMKRWQKDSVRRFHEAAELGDRHYRLGSLPIATYLELQREYLDALDSILTLQEQAFESRLQLQSLTGVPINGNPADKPEKP